MCRPAPRRRNTYALQRNTCQYCSVCCMQHTLVVFTRSCVTTAYRFHGCTVSSKNNIPLSWLQPCLRTYCCHGYRNVMANVLNAKCSVVNKCNQFQYFTTQLTRFRFQSELSFVNVITSCCVELVQIIESAFVLFRVQVTSGLKNIQWLGVQSCGIEHDNTVLDKMISSMVVGRVIKYSVVLSHFFKYSMVCQVIAFSI